MYVFCLIDLWHKQVAFADCHFVVGPPPSLLLIGSQAFDLPSNFRGQTAGLEQNSRFFPWNREFAKERPWQESQGPWQRGLGIGAFEAPEGVRYAADVLDQLARQMARLRRVGARVQRIGQPAQALSNGLDDLVVAADRGEQVHD